jgi:hypothetical protein
MSHAADMYLAALTAQLNATRRGPQKGDDLAADFFGQL